jgi:uncharacterized protein (DUF433 family)
MMPFDIEDHEAVWYALRHPRGRYVVDRAAQLSGVPRSTLYDWRREAIYVPDFDALRPIAWSYRDLVYLRLLAWLRQLGMPPPKASNRVASVKWRVSEGARIRRIRTDGRTLVLDDEVEADPGGENLLPFDDFAGLLRTFDLLEPIEELRRRGQRRVWAPDLVTPSSHTFISPWVLAGDPCVDRSRIPTAAIHALREERGLSTADVVQLYPGLTPEAADDAFLLERRLRGFELPTSLAA